jgi:hypothetical protein
MRAWWGLALLLVISTAGAQETSKSLVRLDFSNPSIIPAHWELVMYADGRGHFHAERGNAKDSNAGDMEPLTIDEDVHLSGPFAAQIFAMLEHHRVGDGRCESHSKVAFQGMKTLAYQGPEFHWSCSFNYSKDKEVTMAADLLMSVAATLVEGARLELIWQHDPLGLDKELEFLNEASADGRLQQICAIREILTKLAADTSVMERVRKRARTLAQCNP